MYRPARYMEIPCTDILSFVFGNTDYDQDKAIYIDAHNESNNISCRQAKSFVKRLISGFKARGLCPGDSVCVHSFNNIYYSLIYLAIIGAEGSFVGSNPAYTTFEINHLLSVSKAKFIIVEPELVANVLPAAHDRDIQLSKIFLFNSCLQDISSSKFESWNALLQYGERDWHVFDDEYEAKTKTAALMATSGTTGLPKAAAISHYAHVAQSMLLYDSKAKPYKVLRLLCLPGFHAFAAPLTHLAPLREGHATYIMKRFNLGQFVEYVSRFGITETSMVNPIVTSLLALPPPERKCLTSVRFVWCAGAPLDASVQNQLRESLHQEGLVSQVWGMSEAGWITTFYYPENDTSGSVGRLLPNMEAKIVDEASQEQTDDGSLGEILIRGPSTMTCYLNNNEATKRTIIDGWLVTGDIGYQREGKWYIVDRAKDIIKVRGWQVSPTELETCLREHQRIVDAAVIGVDWSDGRGELPRAYIVVDHTSPVSLTDQEIHDYMSEHLAKYKALAGGIQRVEEIPRSVSGKILKTILRKAIEREVLESGKPSPSVTDVSPSAPSPSKPEDKGYNDQNRPISLSNPTERISKDMSCEQNAWMRGFMSVAQFWQHFTTSILSNPR